MTILLWLLFLAVCESSPPEDRLLKDLLRGYLVNERPVVDSSEPVIVKLGLNLQQIIDLNERMEQLTVNMWLKYEWSDCNLRWDPSEYSNVTDLRYPSDRIWKPDVLLYNSVDSAFDTTYKVNIVGLANGEIIWIPPGLFTISCKLDIYYWPFDDQVCFFKFGSWSFNGHQIDLTPGDFSIAEYLENGEWRLINVWVKREERFYGPTQDPFQNVQFFMHLRRRTLYYAFNLLMPCTLVMILVLLGFTLNPWSCEKVGLQISVSLAIVLFMTIMANMTPQTSESVPLLGVFFQSCMVLSVCATAFTVYVQSVHFRCHSGGKRMGFWTKYLLLELMPYILRIKQPKHKHTFRSVKTSFKQRNLLSGEHEPNEKAEAERFTEHIDRVVQQINPTDGWMAKKLATMNEIYKRIRALREANDDTKEEHESRSEWQFAAIVVDRLCLIFFTFLFLCTGATMLVRAPYLVA